MFFMTALLYRKIWDKLNGSVGGSALLIAFFSIISKLLGLLRDRLLASYFGAGSTLDAYYAAFKLPDLIFNTLVLGALAAAFIPLFTKIWLQDKERAIKFSNVVLNYLLLILVLLSAGVFIFAKQLMPLIVPGFAPEVLAQTILLTRIMLGSIVFFSLSNVIGGVLNARKKFFSFSLAPVFYNFGIILGIVFLYPRIGLTGLAWGVVFGSALHFLIQLPEVIKNGWHYSFDWRIFPEVKRCFQLMIPRTIGLAASQINLLVVTMITSTLAAGSLAIFTFANNLESFPTSIIGVSLAVAAFPIFSESLAMRDDKRFVSAFSMHFRRMVFLIIPLSLLFIILRAQIVRIILGSGSFDWDDTYHTAQTLGWFSVSLFAQTLIPLLARAFYALEDTMTPVVISLVSVGINIGASIYLGHSWGVEGLAAAFSISAIFNMAALLFVLRMRLGDLDDKNLIRSTFKITFNSIVAVFISYLMLRVMSSLVDMQTFWGVFWQAGVATIIGLIVYLILAKLTKSQEIKIIFEMLNKLRLQLKAKN